MQGMGANQKKLFFAIGLALQRRILSFERQRLKSIFGRVLIILPQITDVFHHYAVGHRHSFPWHG
ncbi:hypothetical protein KCP70_19775 [Salmonella enterica subsp. enterica]|nr:hypothetical protein KCP70_19775 [Salmonella enterica subsp. enterica]